MNEYNFMVLHETERHLSRHQYLCTCPSCWQASWLESWAAIGWLGSTDILQQTFQGAMTHTIAALMNFKNAVDALHSRQDNMRVDLAKLQQRLK